MQKEILILAKSVKHGGCCVAGIEVGRSADGLPVLGNNWVRPVTAVNNGSSSGAIPKDECNHYSVGDLVWMNLQSAVPVCAQQENWTWAGTSFRKSGELDDNRRLEYLTNTDNKVWFDRTTVRDDQISESVVLQQKISHSLMLVAPQHLVFSLELEQASYGVKKRVFASFTLGDKTYQRISVTDPAVRKVFSNQFPNTVGQAVTKTLNHGDGYWLTLSLSPKFVCGNGRAHHYVLVAAVIDHTGYLNRRYG